MYAKAGTRPSRALPLAPIATSSGPQYASCKYAEHPAWQWTHEHASPSTSSNLSPGYITISPPFSYTTPDTTHASTSQPSQSLRRKPSRPLPTIPISPTVPLSAPVSPAASSSSKQLHSPSRPLPTPPHQSEFQYPFPAVNKRDASPISRSAGPSRLPTPHHSPNPRIRPLPVPTSRPSSSVSADASRSAPPTPSASSRTPSLPIPVRPSPPQLQQQPVVGLTLRVDAPGLPLKPTEITLDSPIGPMSPIIFSRSPSSLTSSFSIFHDEPTPYRMSRAAENHMVVITEEDHEDRVAKGLTELGFVEVDMDSDDDADSHSDTSHSQPSHSRSSTPLSSLASGLRSLTGSRKSSASDLRAPRSKRGLEGQRALSQSQLSLASSSSSSSDGGGGGGGSPEAHRRPPLPHAHTQPSPLAHLHPHKLFHRFYSDFADIHTPAHAAQARVAFDKVSYDRRNSRLTDEFVIRVELDIAAACPSTHATSGRGKKGKRRSSRVWVREKKGKRWVENDYLEVLQQLRKL